MSDARHITGNDPVDATMEDCSWEISPFLYSRLQYLAAFHLRRERHAHAVDPEDLISEVYLRLAGADHKFADQNHFFAISSRIMKQVLVDHARKHLAAKRGSGNHPTELEEAHAATDRPRELVELDSALDELVRLDERKARVTVLHYFGGLTQGEIATLCGMHANTVSRDLRDSEAWLRRRLKS